MSLVTIVGVVGVLGWSTGRSRHSFVLTFVAAALLAGGVWYFLTKDGGRGGASLGKRWNGLAVLHRPTWQPCSRSRSALRALVRIVHPFVVPLIEGGAVLLSPLRLSLADRLARTQVVEAPGRSWKGVLASIGVCLGALYIAVLVPVQGMLSTARRLQAQTDLQTVDNCLELFRSQRGSLPTPAEGLAAGVTTEMCRASLIDPWGHAFEYVCPGRDGPRTCDIRSYGRDGRPGGEGEDEDILRTIHVDPRP